MWYLARGNLDPVEEDSGAAGTDVPGGKGLQGSVDDGLSAFAVEPVRYCDADFARASGTLGAGVKVTERAAAHGGRLARESAGHDVTTFVVHEVPSCRRQGAPIPTRGVWNKLSIFNALEAWFYRKLFVLRSLEGKLMKTANLRGSVRDAAGLRTAHNSYRQVSGLREITGKWAVSGRR